MSHEKICEVDGGVVGGFSFLALVGVIFGFWLEELYCFGLGFVMLSAAALTANNAYNDKEEE